MQVGVQGSPATEVRKVPPYPLWTLVFQMKKKAETSVFRLKRFTNPDLAWDFKKCVWSEVRTSFNPTCYH